MSDQIGLQSQLLKSVAFNAHNITVTLGLVTPPTQGSVRPASWPDHIYTVGQTQDVHKTT